MPNPKPWTVQDVESGLYMGRNTSSLVKKHQAARRFARKETAQIVARLAGIRYGCVYRVVGNGRRA